MNAENNHSVDGAEKQATQWGLVYPGPGAKHDQAPFKLRRLTSSQSDAIQKAKKYAMEQNIKTVLVKQTIAHQQQQMQSMQNALQKQQAWSLMCRIYVGSINFEIKEDTIQQAFLPFGPMKSFHLAYDSAANKHKGFSFIEYETPEAASLALEQMNGVVLGGRNIKVGRPSNMPQAQTIIENYLLEAQQYHRLYVSSIHPDLSESDLKSVFEAFGKVVSCKLAFDPVRPGKHKGYAFIQYDNAQSSHDAVSAMNLFDLGGQYIRVGKAVTPPNVNLGSTSAAPMPTATAVAAAAITAKITALDAAQGQNPTILPPKITLSTASSSPLLVQPGICTQSLCTVTSVPYFSGNGAILNTTSSSSLSVMVTLPDVVLGTFLPVTVATNILQDSVLESRSASASFVTCQERYSGTNNNEGISTIEQLNSFCKSVSRVIVLSNMVGKEDIDDDLGAEVHEECSKYGEVRRVVIHEQRPTERNINCDDQKDKEVKIFVEYFNSSASEKAINALDGRFFGGRKVCAQFYKEASYENNCFSD